MVPDTTLVAALSGDQTKTATYALLQGRLLLTQEPLEAERLLRFALLRGMGSANLYLGRIFEARGDLSRAKVLCQGGFSGHFIDQSIGVTLCSLRSNDDLLPQLLRTGMSRDDAAAWLELAGIYEAEGNPAAAQKIYAIPKSENPFFEIPSEK